MCFCWKKIFSPKQADQYNNSLVLMSTDTEKPTYFATQDGTMINESFVDDITSQIEKVLDKLEDYIDDELDSDSDESLGN